jgi:hypothetical protein
MGGFFIDSVIRSIARSIRRETRATSASRWPVIDAKSSTFSAPKVGERGRPYLLYIYELVSAKFSLSHAAISAPQLLDFEALLGSV